MAGFDGNVEVLFFAYRVDDLRRGFRAAAKAIAENGIDAQKRGSVVVPLGAPVFWAHMNVVTTDSDSYLTPTPVIADDSVRLSIVHVRIWAPTVADVVSILRSRSLLYDEPPADRSPEAQLSGWCTGELRSGEGHTGYGSWSSRWIELSL